MSSRDDQRESEPVLGSSDTITAVDAEPAFMPCAVSVGDLVDGTHRVVREIGRGGFGVVFLAHDERLDRDVAIKVILPGMAVHPDFRENFVSEARAMARVRHENVVAIHSFGEVHETPYFVMEYVPGVSLGAWLKNRAAAPSVSECLGILTQLGRGLQAIHDAGAVHQDIKPNNVLLGSGFRVAIADLGLAKIPGAKKRRGTLVGTPAYMAPEIISDSDVAEELAKRADVYSFGVLAFQLLTGRLPFKAPNSDRMLDRHLLEEPPAPSKFASHLPSAFDAPILNALVKDPEKRTASANELVRALRAAQDTTTAPCNHRIVIADDDEDLLELVEATVKAALPGARVESVLDGEAALQALDREPAQMAILDLDMPGMNGIELTAVLQASESTRGTSVLVMTAAGGAPDWRVLSQLGADAFLVKPFEPAELARAVRRLVGWTPGPPH